MRYKSESADDTRRIAGEIAKQAVPGEIYCLQGDLGAGKTVFAQGFALGLGYCGEVTSPTFTLVHEYIGGRLPVYHFDLYRLDCKETSSGNVLDELGYEEYFYGDGVCLVEWPERAGTVIPEDARWITVAPDYGQSAEHRDITIK